MATLTSPAPMTMMKTADFIPSGLSKHCTFPKTVHFGDEIAWNKRIKMACLKVSNNRSLKVLMSVKDENEKKLRLNEAATIVKDFEEPVYLSPICGKKMYNAYFDPLKLFGKNGSSTKFKAKKLDEDDTEGDDGNDKEPEWLKKLGEILEKYKSLTKLNSYLTLIATILKAAWFTYKFILKPGYVMGKKLFEPKPGNAIIVADQGKNRDDSSTKMAQLTMLRATRTITNTKKEVRKRPAIWARCTSTNVCSTHTFKSTCIFTWIERRNRRYHTG